MSRQDPIRIGYCLSLTGSLAGNSRSAQLAHEIWRDDINRRNGLLGRPVELLCYDDEADASRVPALYRRLNAISSPFTVASAAGRNRRRS